MHSWKFPLAILLGLMLWSPLAAQGPVAPGNGEAESVASSPPAATHASSAADTTQGFIAGLTIFVLAVFVGFEVITKVPPTLHTPLMSGSNAISGITLVGALVAAGEKDNQLAIILGTIAVALATVNVVGGFLVTHRMLQMFRKR